MIFRNFEYFITIADAGSLTRAAEILYVSQPSLSQYLKRLESNLGVELFDHSTSPLKLTYIGERYYKYARQVQQLDENAQKEFRDIQNDLGGRLKLGVPFWRGACMLPDVFPAFHQKYPAVKLELTEKSSSDLLVSVINGRTEIAVINLPKSYSYDEVNVEIICEERILIAAPNSHPYVQSLLAKGEHLDGYPLAPLEIVEHIPLISTKPGQNLTHEIRMAMNKHNIEPDILLETGNLTTAINLTAQGLGCCFVPEEGAKVCQHPGLVTFFAVDTQDLIWELGVIYQKGEYVSNLARHFIASMREQLSSRKNKMQ